MLILHKSKRNIYVNRNIYVTSNFTMEHHVVIIIKGLIFFGVVRKNESTQYIFAIFLKLFPLAI